MDAANLNEEELLVAWSEASQVMKIERNGCLALIDATNTPMSVPILNKAREVAAMAAGDPRYCVAFVGMKGLTKSTAQLHARTTRVNAHFCDTVEDAKEWLIKEAARQQAGRPP